MDILDRLRWFEKDEEARANLPAGLFLMAKQAADEIDKLRAVINEIADEHPYPGYGDELQQIARTEQARWAKEAA